MIYVKKLSSIINWLMGQKLRRLACSGRGTRRDRLIGESSIRTRTKAMGYSTSRGSKTRGETVSLDLTPAAWLRHWEDGSWCHCPSQELFAAMKTWHVFAWGWLPGWLPVSTPVRSTWWDGPGSSSISCTWVNLEQDRTDRKQRLWG